LNLLDPLGLLGLSALVPVIALYFLKLKREERTVPSTLLWKKVIEDMQVNAPFQRLKYSLLLLLQILLIGLFGFSLARPYLNIGGLPGKKTVLLIDTSASMATRDSGADAKQSRLDAAIRDAKTKIDDLRQGDEMALIAFDRDTRQLSKFTSDRSMLKQLLDTLQTHDLDTRGDEAFEAALAAIQGKDNAEVLVLSDGCFDLKLDKERAEAAKGNTEDTKASLPDRLKNFRFIAYGGASDNVGITQMNARTRTIKKKGSSAEEVETVIFVTVENFASTPREVVLSIASEGVQFPTKVVQLKGRTPRAESSAVDPAKETTTDDARSEEVFKLPTGTKGVVTARIVSPKDAFPNDDVASVVIEDTESISLLLVSKENYFLEKALASMRGVTVKKVDPDVFLKEWEQKGQQSVELYDACIFDRVAPVTWTDGGALFFGAMPPVAGFVKNEKPLEWPRINYWDSDHPLMRYVSFGNVTIKTAQSWTVPKAAKAIVEGPIEEIDSPAGEKNPDGSVKKKYAMRPLVTAFESDRVRVIGVAFDIFDTDWPSRPALPLFCGNALPWLAQASSRRRPSAQRTGEPLSIPAGLGNGPATVLKPDGSSEGVILTKEHTTFVKGTEKSGLYELKGIPGEEKSRLYAFNLANHAESDNGVRDRLKIGEISMVSQPNAIQAKREIWRWLALGAAFILLAEWWVYHRRIGL
jgi:Ca-activated chloride channel family protein